MIYLDNAATTFPKPESVCMAMDKCMREYAANPGRSGHSLSLRAGRAVWQTRELIAALFNIDDPMRVILTSNATESLNIALKGSLKPGDHVVTSGMEHNSVIRPLNALADRGITFTAVPCGTDGTMDPVLLEKAIRPDTRMIAMIHASNVTGTLMPAREAGRIAKAHGLLYLADISQTAGVMDIDVEDLGCDLMAAPGHKGLLGPQGTGFLYIKEGTEVRPLIEGGTGSRSEESFQPLIMPDRYESGTPNTPGLAGLGAGIDFILRETVGKIRKHEAALTKFFLDELALMDHVTIYGPKDADRQTGVVALNIEGMDSSETAYRLDESFGICVRSGLHCAPLAHKTVGSFETGAVRFSFGYFNTEDDAAKAVDALKKLL